MLHVDPTGTETVTLPLAHGNLRLLTVGATDGPVLVEGCAGGPVTVEPGDSLTVEPITERVDALALTAAGVVPVTIAVPSWRALPPQ